MKEIKTFLFLGLLLLETYIGLFGQTNQLQKDFPASSPEEQGMSSSLLDSLLIFLKNTNQNIHHLTIIRNNRTVLDADIYPYSSRDLHDIASVTKSITSLLIGIAIDKGFIKNENEPVLSFFPDAQLRDSLFHSLTIRDLLTMRSGFACSAEDGEKALSNMRKSTDWIKFIFQLPMTSNPGETFSYCSCNFYLLGDIIYRATKLTPEEFAKKYLFMPLQINNTRWLKNDKGINHGWGDLFLYPADMTKIGKMVLDKGKWRGRQIISSEWISKSLKSFSKLPDHKGYGYGWWTNDKVGYYEAAGRGRQTISIIPSKNVVVTMLGGEFDAGAIGGYIFKSIQSDKSLSAAKKDYYSLTKKMREVAKEPLLQVVPINNGIVQKLDKRTIIFEKNIAEIDSMQFHFLSKEKGMVTFYNLKWKQTYPFLFSSNTYALAFDSTLLLPVALNASFTDKEEFVLHFNQLCRINNFYFHFRIAGNSITTTMEETTNSIKTQIGSSFR